MNNTISVPVITQIEDFFDLPLKDGKNNLVYIPIGTLLEEVEKGSIQPYKFNRGTGKLATKTVKTVRKNFMPESYGPIVAVDRQARSLSMVDGHSSTKGLLERQSDGKLTSSDLKYLVAVRTVDKSKFISTYTAINGGQSHSVGDKLNNPEMLIGRVALKIQSILNIDGLTIPRHTDMYGKLVNVLITYNHGGLKPNDHENNSAEYVKAYSLYYKELQNKDATYNTKYVQISHGFEVALKKFGLWFSKLSTHDNDLAQKIAHNIGMIVVLMFEFLTNGVLNQVNLDKLVDNSDCRQMTDGNTRGIQIWNTLLEDLSTIGSVQSKRRALQRISYEKVVRFLKRHKSSMPPGQY